MAQGIRGLGMKSGKTCCDRRRRRWGPESLIQDHGRIAGEQYFAEQLGEMYRFGGAWYEKFG
jgi:hypothetical protein